MVFYAEDISRMLPTSERFAQPLPQLRRAHEAEQDADYSYTDADQRKDGFVGP